MSNCHDRRKWNRSSQLTCTQMALHVHKNLCPVPIPLCKNNLNMPMCSSFFLPCGWLSSPLVQCCHASYLNAMRWFFCLFCLYRSWFCSPAINQISLSQSKDWFPLILLCKREKCHWTGPLGFRINYTMISELYQHMYSYTCIIFTEEWK